MQIPMQISLAKQQQDEKPLWLSDLHILPTLLCIRTLEHL